jgi:hypothetical protein
MTSFPAAAAPLRLPAQGRSPACVLQAATVSGAPPRQRLRHWLSLPCYRRPASSDFWPWLAFSRTARRLRRQLRSRLRRLRWVDCRARAARFHTAGSRVTRFASEHNSVLSKVGQSLRRASLCGLPLARPSGSDKSHYVLRPFPATAISACCAAWVYSGATRWVVLIPARPAVGLRRLALRCSFPPRLPRSRPPRWGSLQSE